MVKLHPRLILVTVLGLCSWLPYLAARGLGDLRANTVGFELAFLGAFALYLIAVALILRPFNHLATPNPQSPIQLPITNYQLLLFFSFAVLFRLTLLPTRPTLSDDMYRYVWDGRVQAHGLSPYRYAPDAPQVAPLAAGDHAVWGYVNRKQAVTVYPPGAQLAFALAWRAVGDSVIGFKAAFVLAELLGAVLLLRLLRALSPALPPERLLIYLWSPLLIFEVAHAGHVDGLMLSLLIGALWARVEGRPWLLGLTLGAATLVKLFPALLLPALLPIGQAGGWSERTRPAAKMLAAMAATLALGYLPYVFQTGAVVGFLPQYFKENFNLGLARLLFNVAPRLHTTGAHLANVVTFGGLAVLGVVFVLRPARDGRAALWRCAWLVGWFTLFTQNLFPWYLLWLLPLLTVFVEPGRLLGLRLAPATAWLLFSGTSALAYLFFIRWRVAGWAQLAEYVPLYLLLLLPAAPHAWAWLALLSSRVRARVQRPAGAEAGGPA